MKILITGANGQLGYELARVLSDHELILTDLPQTGIVLTPLDITNGEMVYVLFEEEQPDIVIHCAAYTAVDKAQHDSERAFEVNRDGSQNVAEAAASIKAKLITISTDYVFDGSNPPKNGYSEDDMVNPINVYGESKLAGEIATLLAYPDAYILRTAWLYGGRPKLKIENSLKIENWKLKIGNSFFKNFPNAILEKARLASAGGTGESLSVVDDQIGSPTYAKHVAQGIKDLIEKDIPTGLYHMVNSGQASWFDFAQEIIKLSGLKATIQPIKGSSLKQPTKRPSNSVLNANKLASVGIELPTWQEGLKDFLS